MKKIHFILYFLISFSIISCSNDDDVTVDPQAETPSKLLKKEELFRSNGIFYDKTISYNSDNKVQSIVINKYQASPFVSTLSVEYANNSISTIREVYTYESQFIFNTDVTYNVSVGSGVITLTSDYQKIEILHSNGYVDIVSEIRISDAAILRRSVLTRDSNNNLTSIQFSNGNVINSYSDFDSDKKENVSSVIVDVMDRDYITIFGLKVTANNPRTATQSILGTAGPLRTHTYEYDEEGYVTKIIDPNQVNYLDVFYIEQ